MFLRYGSIAALLISIVFNSAASAGGGGCCGGGDFKEGDFRDEVKALMEDIVNNWSDKAKAALKFDPNQILTNLSIPGRFEPLCAAGAKLDQIRSDSKAAEVFPDAENIVYLDCQRQDWKEKLNSNKPADKLLFIHEAVRNARITTATETEDDFGISTTYLDGSAIESKERYRILKDLIYPRKHARCIVKINDGDYGFDMTVSGKEVYTSPHYISGVTLELLNHSDDGTNQDAQETAQEILKVYDENDCGKGSTSETAVSTSRRGAVRRHAGAAHLGANSDTARAQ